MNTKELSKIATDYEKIARLKEAMDRLEQTDVSIPLYRVLSMIVEIIDGHLGTPALPASLFSGLADGMDLNKKKTEPSDGKPSLSSKLRSNQYL